MCVGVSVWLAWSGIRVAGWSTASLAIWFHFVYAQHVSDINISFIRSLRLFCWITTLVVLFLVRCVLEFRCGWLGVVSVLQAEALLHLLFYFTSYVFNMLRTKMYLSSGTCDYSVELPHWSIVLGSMCVGVSVWLVWSGIRVAGWSFSLQHGYHSNPTAPNLQHTSNQEENDQCGNSTEYSQAPDDGYINVRNMLSI